MKYIIFDENSTITEIDDNIFDYCAYSDDLFVVIPTSITTIGNALNTQNYTTYYLYYGTEEQWNTNVTVGHPYSYEVYFYSEEEPTSEGNYWHFDENGYPVLWEFE